MCLTRIGEAEGRGGGGGGWMGVPESPRAVVHFTNVCHGFLHHSSLEINQMLEKVSTAH